MRYIVNEWLKDHGITLLHPDVWPYDGVNVINCGVAEQALTAVALGIAEDRPCAIYGIAGFVLLKASEVIKLYQPKHAILLLNAGANGCYPKDIGIGHQIGYDEQLSTILGCDLHDPYEGKDPVEMGRAVVPLLNDLVNKPGWHLIRLGHDIS